MPSSEKSAPKKASSPHLWVSTTYFAEGFPYSVVHTLAEVLFKEFGASLQAIGLTSLFHLPWNLKFLWGPLLDAFSTKRTWLLGLEVAIAASIAALALVSSTPLVLALASMVFVLLAVLSATHDISIDGYYLEGLDTEGQSKFVGYRATAYKISMLVVSGPLIWMISKAGWTAGFFSAAVIMTALLLYHWSFLPRVERVKRPFSELAVVVFRPATVLRVAAFVVAFMAIRSVLPAVAGLLPDALENVSLSGWVAMGLLTALGGLLVFLPGIKRRLEGRDSFYANAFVDFLEQDRVGWILAFVVLFRTGESFLLKMRYPFLREAGMSMEQYALASGTIGLIASFVATLLGGYLISKHGLRRWIWPFVILQNALNLLYMVVAAADGPIGMPALTTVISTEAFGAGLGTAVFMVYLMRCCRPEYKAAHMAVLTALMSVSFTLAGVASGFLAEWMGFRNYFGFTFLAAVPGMALIAFLPKLDEPRTP